MKIKNVAILTSGGDAPGMNSALYGVYTACKQNNINLYAVIKGYDGLIDNNFVKMDFCMLENRLNRGGSIIKSGRSSRFLVKKHFNTALNNLKQNNIDALIIVGGDGSLRGALKLIENGINVVTLPGTIDNDLNFDYTIGFDTASNNIVSAIDNINDCLYSFDYGAVIKIMGRDCPDLINTVAQSIHTPFVINDANYDLNKLIKDLKIYNEMPPIVLVRENCADCNELSAILQQKTKRQWRPHILGYIQRGGTPSAFDRRYGYSAGLKAVALILQNKFNLSVGMENDVLVCKDIASTIKYKNIVDKT